MENPIKMDDLGVPLFLETPISSTCLRFFCTLVISPYLRCNLRKRSTDVLGAGVAGCLAASSSQVIIRIKLDSILIPFQKGYRNPKLLKPLQKKNNQFQAAPEQNCYFPRAPGPL